MKKLLLFILLLFPLYVNAGSDLKQEIFIRENGDLLIKQEILLDGEYNGFEMNIKYKYKNNYKIYSADTYEIIKVCEKKTNELNCFDEVSNDSTATSKVYKKNSFDEFFNLKIYNSSSLVNTPFYIEYILKNVIVKHNDIAELRLNLLDEDFKEKVNNYELYIYLPNEDNSFKIWAHGPLWGEIDKINNKSILLKIKDHYKENIDVRVVFDKELINTIKTTNIDMLDNIVNEETKLANEANLIRENIIKRNKLKSNFIKYFNFPSLLIYLIGLTIIWIVYYKKHDKEHNSLFTEKYYRDVPNEYGPELVQYLFNQKIDKDALSASLLNIIRKKGFTVEEIIETKRILKKETKDYKIKSNFDLKEELTENENFIKDWFIQDYAINNEFKLSDIEKYNSKSIVSSENFIRKFNEWKIKAKKEALNENLFYDKSNNKILPVLYCFIPILLIFLELYLIVIAIPFSAMFLIYLLLTKKRTEKGNELYSKYKAFKKFLKDFGKFEDKELPEIILWEKFLVYATVFKISEKLLKQMKFKIKEIDTNTNLNNNSMISYFYLNSVINRNIQSSFNSAYSAASTKIAQSRSSNGSGFGGGFSGSGGFGGGGGMSGGRF